MLTKKEECIHVKGARVHNLKNIDLKIPRNKFVVVTGVSGSGKSSLAFDTLYAEGQRRYVESLSSYARQFLGRIDKPEVDFIKGIPPAVAIEQKVNTRNPRSTVGTSTEIYDYLKLLFARIGKTISPVSGVEVTRHDVSDVVNFIFGLPEKSRVMILAPLQVRKDRSVSEEIEVLNQQGFSRIDVDGKILQMDAVKDNPEQVENAKDIFLLIDRLAVSDDEDTISRAGDSVQTSFYEGNGTCVVREVHADKTTTDHSFSNRFEADGIVFEEPSVHMFSFNNPIGACPKCEGYGKVMGIDRDLVIPNKSLSIFEDAIACWRGEKMGEWKRALMGSAQKFDFPIHAPYHTLTEAQKELLWTGNNHFEGLDLFFQQLEEQTYKIQYRVMLSRYRGKTLCPDCKGTRLKQSANYVHVGGEVIQNLVLLPVNELKEFFANMELVGAEKEIADRLLLEIRNRIEFLCDVGLGYLTLNRLSASLSGGESQRINLVTSLGSSLVGSMYILDEPSIGLHSRDTMKLIKVLRRLQGLGNTVVVVEHDEDIIREADEVIDIGPFAGTHGGEVVFQGDHSLLIKKGKSLTADYLTGKKEIEIPSIRRNWKNFIQIEGARENNLKNVDVKIPLNILTVITGVSGSGKSSLIRNILWPMLTKYFGEYGEVTGEHDAISGDVKMITGVEFVDQNPIGKSSRSNPVTYLKAFDEIRKLYADQQASKLNAFKASHFSFNIDGGRCDECQGEGEIKVEMQFMADIHLVCESCSGKRFKEEVLDVKYREHSIFDILELTVNQAVDLFSQGKTTIEKKIVRRLIPLQSVGLGYLKLGQSSSTLSGGESQRIKLASFLAREKDSPTLFIFDEPTTGLHFHDVKVLLEAFQALISRGHTILIIEHNMDVIKCADWLIDLGPDGGIDGGNVVFEGIPEEIVKDTNNYTGKFLKEKFV